MIILQFILPIFFGFYMIYKSIKVLDKIDRLKKNGIRKQARVIKIREEIGSQIDDNYGSSRTYYYTVNFKNKNGREIEKEIEFGLNKKPKRNPPFSISILYNINKNKDIDITFENSRRIILDGFLLLFIGLLFLGIVLYNYNGQINIILDFIKNILK
ncbi:hypothetical protein [Polaribacter aquimarinus]|uniref:DUF3592 domain-containing protein n=1 Tax=Polaribacter aquimarinus TaxID=2100726 RepID=A0A2U2JAI1_9FLAO|nr:hypothetical protein [Polaribacter aquimarinus]PWG05281.1 hypothetical protein DIS07_08575 [Polaribacter aquimarinus]